MQSVNSLGIKVVLITTLLITVVVSTAIGMRYLIQSRQQQEEYVDISHFFGGTSSQEQDPSLADSDQDGLPDLIENIYRTDLNNPDSDGDGTTDGEEVRQQRDPALAGPNDTINVQPETLHPDSYTTQYFSTLPEGVLQSDVANQERLTAFVDQSTTPLLPDLATITVITSPEEGSDAVRQYLETISSSHNNEVSAISSTDIEAAFSNTDSQIVTEQLSAIISQLNQNLSIFKNTPVPAEAANLHKKLIASTQTLTESVALMQNMRQDFIGGLIGIRQVEKLATPFQEISAEIVALENKYSLN